jgi:signal peptidase I
MTGRGRKWIWRGAAIAVAGLLWGFFAPPALGGSTTVLMVRGTSMLPRFHTGDLVLVRKGDAYRVGMLAAYDALPFHAVFFHQIVGRAGNRYVFKGLNNRVADPYHPPASEIIGAYWFSIPTVGLWLQFWRQPGNAALLVAATALVAAATSPRRRRDGSAPGVRIGASMDGGRAAWRSASRRRRPWRSRCMRQRGRRSARCPGPCPTSSESTGHTGLQCLGRLPIRPARCLRATRCLTRRFGD